MQLKGSDNEKEIGQDGKDFADEVQVEYAVAHDAAARGHLATDE
jgi:hypothetical protein